MSGSVARPKVYIDYISYFRAAGLGVNTDFTNSNINEDYSDVYTYSPYNTKTFTPVEENDASDGTTALRFKAAMGNGTGEGAKLVESINYCGILNHNHYSLDNNYLIVHYLNQSFSLQQISPVSVVYGYKNNFHLMEWDSSQTSNGNNYGISATFTYSNWGDPLRLGSIIAGRSYTFPHNANLSMNIDYNADGIRTSRTLGGHDIVDVNYYKQPDWDGNPPFVTTHASGLSATSHIGRRSWALTFSFLTATDTFPQDMGENFMFDNVFDADGSSTSWANHTTENITSHFMTLTMNGQLGFLFQPDDTKNTFAWCKLRSNSFSVQQSAPNLYTCKMTFDETW